ncbi:hypothetical protein PCC9214_00132 [Planktothrix tepida]|uniref:Type II toxin-antitoxin system RelE/ParE family toxin n=2 Tax=Planktothrix TaxID=54304 RepID=A0A1J1LHR9_9CYAN|nr:MULTISPECIES: hypothetical protein [Planktothrix]CAD5912510.1 hypothetical protein PCC9214_00132 [Planktothrix tepida]CAD5986592.1 hypothetical protein NO713_05676 [Planktothrix pseudagardhii]CUR32027.1 conserved hypothetical protein [Planktothrix tepida PCC 9214]
MNFRIEFSSSARDSLINLQELDAKKYNKVLKTLGLMATNLRHPSLKTHKYDTLSGPNGEEIFEAYVENKTPAAFRVFWYYGPDKGVITVIAITPHP